MFWANLGLLSLHQSVETIVVDGGSQDKTNERIKNFRVIDLPRSKRGERYNKGIEIARGDVILLVHPRTRLTPEALSLLESRHGTSKWGAFRHSFDWPHPLLRFTSWYSNFVRGRRGIFYLDHCLYFSADLKAKARFPDVPIFEDTYFCAELKTHARPELLPLTLKTSAVRFRKNGVIRQSLKNQILKILFHLGASESWMYRVYEKGLWLN